MSVTERRLSAVSKSELERRWALMRRHMEERGLDAIVCVASDTRLAGYSRWLTDSPYGYRRAVMFHRTDLMTVIDHGAMGAHKKLDGDNARYKGVGEVFNVNQIPSVCYSQSYEADVVVRVVLERGYRKIGLIGPRSMPHGFVQTLEEKLANKAAISDETEAVDGFKAIKSPEEMEILTRCAQMQDDIFAKLLPQIKPGMRDFEVAAIAQYEGRKMGSESGAFLAGSAPHGEAAMMMPEFMEGRTIGEGDAVAILIENPPVAGFFAELTRTVVVGKASSELKEACEQAREAQAYTLSLLKPGVPFREVFAKFNAHLESRGLEPERRLYAHGQGYDLVERPLVRDDETMHVAENMCLAIHPSVVTARVFGVVCDNYIVGKNGPGPSLHKTEKKVFEI